MTVDASQLSSKAFADVLAISRSPVIASHAGVRAIVDIDRNLSDDELVEIGRHGGVVQIVGFGPYLRPPTPELRQQLEDLWRSNGLEVTGRLADLVSVNDPVTAEWDDEKFWHFLHEFHVVLDLEHPVATVRDLGDSIDYAVNLAGIDHVGIASDFNHAGGLADWGDSGETLSVTAELIRRGYTDKNIGKLWGENFLRVWDEVIRLRKGSG